MARKKTPALRPTASADIPAPAPAPRAGNGKSLALACVLLAALVLAVYARVGGYELVLYDDVDYIKKSRHVEGGFTPENLAWAFTTFHNANYHPLTWLSHQADSALLGGSPGARHLSNLALHLVNVLLLLLFLRAATGALWPAALGAALFAVHPAHVEAVAWVSARKDTLSTVFLLGCALFYLRWARARIAGRRAPGAYLAALACQALGLLAKPMLVTLPFCLLLLDHWPLGRLDLRDPATLKAKLPGLAAEKLPFFALILASCVMTLVAQSAGGAMGDIEAYPLAGRLANALVSTARYLGMFLVPAGQSVYYPWPAAISWTGACASALVLAGACAGVWRASAARPWLLTGWLWFLGALVPVIGLVQVGSQAMADRYTYAPYLGLYLALAAWAANAAARPRARGAAPVWSWFAGMAVAGLAVTAWIQTGYWKDSRTLFEHAVAINAADTKSRYFLAQLAENRGDLEEARSQYEAMLRLERRANTFNNLGLVLARKGDLDGAERAFSSAATLDPKFVAPLMNLGKVYLEKGDHPRAAACYRKALALAPDNAMAAKGVELTQ